MDINAGQPPDTVVVCSFDPLRDESLTGARRFEDAGVAVDLPELHRFVLLRRRALVADLS